MAFLHSHSNECLKSELDIFSLLPTQTSIESSQYIHYNPISAITPEIQCIEFLIPGLGEQYLDLSHTMLSMRVSISPDNAADNKKVGPINNLLNSLFGQVDVFFNQKLVTPPNNAHPYRAYIETLLSYGQEAKKSHLAAGLWYTDQSGFMDASPDSEDNSGLKERQSYTIGSKQIDLIGHLHCDVFNQDKFLINGVEMRVRLIRNKDSFCLMDNSADGKFSIRITDAALIVRRVKINPGILLAHANGLSKATAKYPITRVEVKSFTLHRDTTGETLDNIILGQLPKRLIIGFIDNKAFNGDRKLNPFNFQHFSINFLSLFVDGVQVPNKPLQPVFEGEHMNYIDCYHTLFSGSGIHYMDAGNGISRKDYPNGYCLFVFDLSQDASSHCGSHWNLSRNGSIRLEVRFSKPLNKTINCLVYAEYDNILEIDSNRQVITDFNS